MAIELRYDALPTKDCLLSSEHSDNGLKQALLIWEGLIKRWQPRLFSSMESECILTLMKTRQVVPKTV